MSAPPGTRPAPAGRAGGPPEGAGSAGGGRPPGGAQAGVSAVLLLLAVGAGLVAAESPLWGALAGAGLLIVAAAAVWPTQAVIGFVAVVPLIVGLDRGAAVPALRLNEVLMAPVAAGLALALLHRWLVLGRPWPVRLHRLDGVVVVLALTASVTTLLWMYARGREITAEDVQYSLAMWKLAALYAMVRLFVHGRRATSALFVALLTSACVVGALGVLQTVGVGPVLTLLGEVVSPGEDGFDAAGGRATSTIGNPHAYGDVMVYMAVVAGALAVVGRRHRRLLAGIAAALAAGSLASGSFSTALALGAAALAFAVLTGTARWLVVGGLVLAPPAYLGLQPVVQSRLSRLDPDTGLPASWTDRYGRLDNLQTYFWPRLGEDFNWLLGVRPASRVPGEVREWVYIESGYTWALWNGGLPLLVAVLVLLVAMLGVGRRLRAEAVPEIRALGLVLSVLPWSLAVLMLLDPHLTIRGGAEILFVLLALAATADHAHRRAALAARLAAPFRTAAQRTAALRRAALRTVPLQAVPAAVRRLAAARPRRADAARGNGMTRPSHPQAGHPPTGPPLAGHPPAGRAPGRRRRRLLAALVVVPVVAGVTWFVVSRDGGPEPEQAVPGVWEPLSASELAATDDALQRRSLAELASFTDWLAANDAQGYIGEVGVPGGPDLDRWTALAQRWFTAADDAGLWVDVWSVGEWWRQDYTYSPFVSAADGGPLALTRAQGDLLTWAAGETDLPRGVNLSGGEFGAPGGSDETTDFSNENPGTYDEDYHYDSQESLDYLASQGIDTVRLPFRWERIQPEIGGPLDPAELDRLVAVVGRADAAGLQVILDVHNFGAYHVADGEGGVRRGIGSPELSAGDFADLWWRLSEAFQDVPGVLAYDLMNEPVYLPDLDVEDSVGAQLWEQASQAAVDAVRDRGDDTLIMVPGYSYSRAADWVEMHPSAWIDDPVDNVRYTAHHYWSPTQGVSYDEDLTEAVDEGY